MVTRLDRGTWLHTARLALLRGGVEAVRVERLARDLRVTKGSFYWHFKDREEVLEFLLREWESEVPEILSQLSRGPNNERVPRLMRLLEERVQLSEEGKAPSDAAIFAWASIDQEVARRVNKAEEKRIQLLKQFVGGHDRTELLYLIWVGYVARGQRVPESRKRFPEVAHLLAELLAEPGSKRRVQLPSRSKGKPPAM